MTNENSHCWVDAETDDEGLLWAWGSSTPEPRINGVDEGHEYFCVYDEKDDGKPEMTKQFKLLFKVPELEVLSFTASLTEAGFSQVVSRPMKKPNPITDEALFEIDSDFTDLQEQFGCAFSQEEAEAVVAGFDGDVKRASKLYRELTEDYVSSMSVEDLIKAGITEAYDGPMSGEELFDEALKAGRTNPDEDVDL